MCLAWEQRKLDEFGISTSGTSIESEFGEGEKYKVISIGSYSENSTYNDQGIRAKLSDKTKKRVLNKGDLTMILNDKTSSGRIIGRVLIIDKSDMYVFNQRTQRIEPYHDKYDAIFLYEMLNAPQIRNKIFSIGISEIVCLFKHLLFEMFIDTSSAFVRSLKIERLILLYIF